MHILSTYEKQIIEFLIQQDRTLSEIAAQLRISKPATSKHLKKLEEHKLIQGRYEKTTAGRTITYHVQPYHLVLSIDPVNKSLLFFTADEPIDINHLFLGFIQQKEFRNDMKQYLSEIEKTDVNRFLILLYGSVAQGTSHRKSDIDVLFLKETWVQNEKNQLLKRIAAASPRCNHQMKPLFTTMHEFSTLDIGFQKQIKDHGVIIYEKDTQWEKVQQQLKRYKTITI